MGSNAYFTDDALGRSMHLINEMAKDPIITTVTSYRRSLLKPENIDWISSKKLSGLEARVFREYHVPFLQDLDTIQTRFGCCPYNIVPHEIFLQDDEEHPDAREVIVRVNRNRTKVLRKAIIDIPVAVHMFTLRVEGKEFVAYDLDGKRVKHMAWSTLWRGPNRHTLEIHSECGVLLKSYLNWLKMLDEHNKAVQREIERGVWLKHHVGGLVTENAIALEKLNDVISQPFIFDQSGVITNETLIHAHKIRQEGNNTILPVHLDVAPTQPPRIQFNADIAVEYGRYVHQVCNVFKVPISMVGSGIPGLHQRVANPIHLIVEEERVRLLDDYSKVANNMAHVARDVWLKIYGEMIPLPTIPLRCIATLGELKLIREEGGMSDAEYFRIMRGMISLTTENTVIDQLVKIKEEKMEEMRLANHDRIRGQDQVPDSDTEGSDGDNEDVDGSDTDPKKAEKTLMDDQTIADEEKLEEQMRKEKSQRRELQHDDALSAIPKRKRKKLVIPGIPKLVSYKERARLKED